MKVSLPLDIILPRKRTVDKKFILNLNDYRNTHYHTLDDAKKIYKEHVQARLIDARVKGTGDVEPPYHFIYTVFPKTKRDFDLGNVLSIVQKFTDDALIDLGLIEDDNHRIINLITYRFGEVDKENPRVELEIA